MIYEDMYPPPVQYVRTSDGYDIAYSVCGEGTPLVLMPEPVSHIQIYWTADTFMRPWLHGLAAKFRLVLYDGRGQGMSSRGLADSHSLEDEQRDLEAVIDKLRLDRLILLARSHVAVRYALQQPERVLAMILVSVPPDGASWTSGLAEGVAQQDWELFLTTLAGLTSPANIAASVTRLRQCINQGDWLRRARAAAASDATNLLPHLKVPVLVLHPRDYRVVSMDASRRLATGIPGAEMTVIDGASSRGDANQGIEAIETFLARHLDSTKAAINEAASRLSVREKEVLRLLAVGMSNQQIADELVISQNTVRRHVSNVFDKTGVANRAQAGAYARDHRLA